MGKCTAKRKGPSSNISDESDVSLSVELSPKKQGNKRGHKRARTSSLTVRAKAASVGGQSGAKVQKAVPAPRSTVAGGHDKDVAGTSQG